MLGLDSLSRAKLSPDMKRTLRLEVPFKDGGWRCESFYYILRPPMDRERVWNEGLEFQPKHTEETGKVMSFLVQYKARSKP